MTGWATASQRQRLRLTAMIAAATMTAQPMCTDGTDDSWSVMPLPSALYTDWW